MRAQDSSSFILLYEHSKVFKIVRETYVRETSIRENDCPGNVRYPALLSASSRCWTVVSDRTI